jgi:actin-related protein 6
MPTLVVDNGAGILKAGLLPPGLDVTQRSLEVAPVRLPNCTAKSRAEKKFFVADGLDTAVELSALYIRRPHDRGYVVNWDLQGDIWQRMCHADVLGIKPSETSVLVSEPLFCPGEVRDNMDEFIFEEMGFQVCPLAPRPQASARRPLLPARASCPAR